MAHLLPMPEVATGSSEAGLSEWSVAEGAAIRAGDVLAVIETDKAAVELEAEEDGVFLRALVAPGTNVEVGQPIALVGSAEESAIDIEAELARLGAHSAHPPADSASTPEAPVSGAAAVPVSGAPVEPAPGTIGPDGGRKFITPLARKLALAAGLDIASIPGSGPHGRVTKRDVERAAARAAALPGPSATAPPATEGLTTFAPATPSGTAPVSAEGRPAGGGEPATVPAPASPAGVGEPAYVDVPHSRMRRAIASRLTQSKQSTPHFYLKASIRADALLDLRGRLNLTPGLKVSLNDLIIKAVARAHESVPEMNVIWQADAVRRYSGVDIAVAVATENGLVTPVVRDVSRMSMSALSRATAGAVERARTGGLHQAELEGGSITVTNLGMYGTKEFSAIINPPHSAILAVGGAREEPVVIDGELAIATVLHVVLSVDHRAVDGVTGARWLSAFVGIVEEPLSILV